MGDEPEHYTLLYGMYCLRVCVRTCVRVSYVHAKLLKQKLQSNIS